MPGPWEQYQQSEAPWSKYAGAQKPLRGAVGDATSNGVPQALQGAPDPEYKPFLSGSNLKDIGTGVLKAGTQAGTLAEKGWNALPGLSGLKVDPQTIQDQENYATANNKGQLFGKVLGTAGGALGAIATGAPAITAAGDFGAGALSGGAAEAAEQLSPYAAKVQTALPYIKGAYKVAKGLGLAGLLAKEFLGH
jgi:hypothetical protein